MSTLPREPVARPFVAILHPGEEDCQDLEKELEACIGKVSLRSPAFAFTHSTYYHSEMGENLVKYYLLFDMTINPTEIVSIKHKTSRLENLFARCYSPPARKFNLDPGYFTHANLILATHKNYSHRFYLGSGVFGELTYIIEGKHWKMLPWTYSDYQREETQLFFLEARKDLLRETRKIRPVPSQRIPMWTQYTIEPEGDR